MTTTRGVVVCPTYQIEGNNFSLNADVSAQELRRYLLYWDRIAYAFPNGFGAPNLDALHDLRFLNQEGLLSLHDTRVTAEDIGYSGVRTPPHISAASGALFSNEEPNTSNPTGLMILGAPASLWRELNYFAPELAAVHLERVDGSVWSVAQTGSVFEFSAGKRNAPIIEASLVGALPVPSGDVPLDDILQFRAKRQPEILRLRTAIDGLREKAFRAEDLHRGLARSRDELETAIQELHRVLSAGKVRTFFSTLKLYLDISDNKMTTTILGAIAAQHAGFPMEIGAVFGLGVNTLLTFTARTIDRPPPLPVELRDFMYLYDINRHWPTAHG